MEGNVMGQSLPSTFQMISAKDFACTVIEIKFLEIISSDGGFTKTQLNCLLGWSISVVLPIQKTGVLDYSMLMAPVFATGYVDSYHKVSRITNMRTLNSTVTVPFQVASYFFPSNISRTFQHSYLHI